MRRITADLIYHLFVMLNAANIELSDILGELENRNTLLSSGPKNGKLKSK